VPDWSFYRSPLDRLTTTCGIVPYVPCASFRPDQRDQVRFEMEAGPPGQRCLRDRFPVSTGVLQVIQIGRRNCLQLRAVLNCCWGKPIGWLGFYANE
jgi:hypothetical protein